MKQKFKGEVLTATKTVNNILRIYDQSKDHSNWYKEASDFAFDLYMDSGVAFIKVCGIIAALSPLKSWDENKRITKSFLESHKSYHTKANTDKCNKILASDGKVEEICDILKGSKTTSFFLNILDPDHYDVVTIDRHAISIAVGKSLTKDGLSITLAQYKFFEECYKIAGHKRNVKGLQMQSVTWVKWRKLKKE